MGLVTRHEGPAPLDRSGAFSMLGSRVMTTLRAIGAFLLSLLMVGALASTSSAAELGDKPPALGGNVFVTDPGDDVQSADAGLPTRAYLMGNASKSVTVSSQRNGSGTSEVLYAGQQSKMRDVDSVHIRWIQGTGYCTYLNGTKQTKYGWVNTAWWLEILIQIRPC